MFPNLVSYCFKDTYWFSIIFVSKLFCHDTFQLTYLLLFPSVLPWVFDSSPISWNIETISLAFLYNTFYFHTFSSWFCTGFTSPQLVLRKTKQKLYLLRITWYDFQERITHNHQTVFLFALEKSILCKFYIL